MYTRDMEEAKRLLETHWIPVNEAPESISLDQEFDNVDFA